MDWRFAQSQAVQLRQSCARSLLAQYTSVFGYDVRGVSRELAIQRLVMFWAQPVVRV